MHKTFLCAALLAKLLVTVPAGADARPSPRGACAAWDLHIVALIEQVGGIEPASMRLAAAAETLTQARVACAAGDGEAALRLYEAIDLHPPARGTQPVFGVF